MKVRDYPDWIMTSLINRGHEPLDDMPPAKAFDEYCEWEGLIGYGATLRDLYEQTVGDLGDT
jgi:hypothetical protein